MDINKLQSAIKQFSKNRKNNSAYYEENWAERKERKEYYQSFTKDKLIAMTEDEFYEYILKLASGEVHAKSEMLDKHELAIFKDGVTL